MATANDSPLENGDKSHAVSPPILKETLPIIIILAVLYFPGRVNFLLFHCMAEYFSIAIACGIFMLA